MNKFLKILLIISAIFVITLALPHDVQASPAADDHTIIGDSYTLESGRILNSNLNVIGGVVEIKETATVNGNMFVLGGLVTIDGTIRGNLTVIGGTVNLNQTAVIEGDLISPVSYVNVHRNARITGDKIEEFPLTGIDVDRFVNVRPNIFRIRRFTILPILTQAARILSTALVLAALGAFLLLIMPKPADRMREALISSPWPILGYGALTGLVVLVLSVFLIVTICLIPVFLLISLTLALAVLVGWLALGYELGRHIVTIVFKRSWQPALTAAFGNFLLYLLAQGVGLIPCLGWFIVFIVMLFALGMTIVTLFGTYPFPRLAMEDDAEEPVVLFEREQALLTETSSIDDPDPVIITPPPPPIEPNLDEDLHLEAEEITPDNPLDDLNLGTRINNILNDAGLKSVQDVLTQLEDGDEHMLGISGFGEKSLVELKEALRSLGYHIPETSDE